MKEGKKGRMTEPLAQAFFLLIACLFSQLIALVYLSFQSTEKTTIYWILSATFTLLYGFFNAVISLSVSAEGSYFSRSMKAYVLLLVGSSGLAFAFSGLSTDGAASIRWIYMMVTFSYFIFITIAFFMRKIIDYAQRQDTEHET